MYGAYYDSTALPGPQWTARAMRDQHDAPNCVPLKGLCINRPPALGADQQSQEVKQAPLLDPLHWNLWL